MQSRMFWKSKLQIIFVIFFSVGGVKIFIFYVNNRFRDYRAEVIKILRKNRVQNEIGHLSDEMRVRVHTLTFNPFHGVESCNTACVKVTNP
jgi:hypothetical protein